MKAKRILLLLFFLTGIITASKAEVNLTLTQIDFSTKQDISFTDPCPGDAVWYKLSLNNEYLRDLEITVDKGGVTAFADAAGNVTSQSGSNPAYVTFQPATPDFIYLRVRWSSTNFGAQGNIFARSHYGRIFSSVTTCNRNFRLGMSQATAFQTSFGICAGGSFDLFLYEVYRSSGYTWTLPQGWSATPGFNDDEHWTISVPSSTPQGSYSIGVQPQGPCSNLTPVTYYPVSVNSPGQLDQVTNPETFVYGSCDTEFTWHLLFPPVPGANSYSLSVNGIPALLPPGQGSIGRIDFDYTGCITQRDVDGVFTVTATGSCGSSVSTFIAIITADPYCGDRSRSATTTKPSAAASVYPNPAVEQINISASTQYSQASLYDATGNVRKTISLRSGTKATALDVRDLPNGLYHLRLVTNKGEVTNQQVIVQH